MSATAKRPPGFTTALISLLALASVTFLGKSYEPLLRGIDSNIHAAVSMSVTSDGFKPKLPIPIKNFSAATPALQGSQLNPNLYFNDHPFFLFWVNGLIMRALGPSAWSARILTGLFSVGTVFIVFLLGNALHSRAFGMLAALFLILCRDFVLTSATMSLDTALVFFIVLTFLFWQKRQWLALGVAAGIGLWIKTPLVLLVFPTALIHDGVRKRLRASIWPLLGAGTLALAVGSLMWIYTGMNGGWELVKDYWVRQLWGTAVGGRAQAQSTDWGFFFYYVKTGFLPALPFLLVALVQIARNRKWLKSAFLVPAIATGIIALVVTGLRFKLGHYVTPAFPFLALISAYSVVDWIQPRETKFYSALTGLSTVLMAVLLINPIPLGPEAFVALKRFMPLIQTHGQCSTDRIALIPGGEPVGSDLDYTLALNFYTGRTVESMDCAKLNSELSSGKIVQWVILSHENWTACLKPEDRRKFSGDFLVGNQHLLTTLISTDKTVDLTPLEVELKAVTDCQAPPYPRDLWHRYVE